MIFLTNPNLPERAETVLLGEKYRNTLFEALKYHGLRPVFIPDNPNVDIRLSSHADLSVFHAGGRRIFAADYLKYSCFINDLNSLGFEICFPDVCQNSDYPHDCGFNICLFGDHVLYNRKTAAIEIIRDLNKERIECNQGYSRCLVSIVNNKSIITSDPGIALACREKGIDVLEISSGHIDLDGFDYGFIGGASFKLSETELVFTGILDEHPDKQAILTFLKQKGVQPIYLTEKKIFDIGSIIPITEKQRI